MHHFQYKNGRLLAEDCDVAQLASTHGTPCYIYSRATLERHYLAFADALSAVPHLICYAVKANSNIAILQLLARLGSGFDIVSAGELRRVLAAGGQADKIVFSGVGKSATEMRLALEVGIRCFNVESEDELERLNTVAGEMGQIAPVSIRVNPDVDAQTHPYISTGLRDNKFGIDINLAEQVYLHAASLANLQCVGVDCHIGSQLTQTAPFADALRRVLVLVDKLSGHGIELKHLDIGGGLGICYRDEQPPEPVDYFSELLPQLEGRNLEIMIEPGRAIAGNAGILVTEVEYLKLNEHKNFAVVDAAMNDLLRPALYSAWQNIQAVVPNSQNTERNYDVVGPICETGDFLGKDRALAITQGDLLAVMSSGAYGFVMSSNYNSRPRAAEILVDGDQAHLVREREQFADLLAGEHLLPE